MKTIVPTNSPDQEALRHIRSKLPNNTLQGVYICFEFPPITSPAASCISRRLAELPQLLDCHIEWTIITPEKSYDYIPVSNQRFDKLFASKLYKRIIRVGDYSVWNGTFDDRWITGIVGALTDIGKERPIDLLCSRSQPMLAHKAALDFVRGEHTASKPLWIAEYSDVVTQNSSGEYLGDNPCYDTTIAGFEAEVFSTSDMVIVTNSNQKKVTFANIRKHLGRDYSIDGLVGKTAVLRHPLFDHCWCSAVKSPYIDTIDYNKINIAYFGVWMYEQRTTSALQILANYPGIALHFFMPEQHHVKYIESSTNNNIRQNRPVDTLEMLNIADNMDYLYVEDSLFPGEINPYLPSKLTDYLSTNTPILARIQRGSSMDQMDNDRMIKFYSEDEITDEFVNRRIITPSCISSE
jgi:hypothetical protein